MAKMPNSMTGYAAISGNELGYAWNWELRAVNARGLDLRFRLPDWIEGLEPLVRAALGPAAKRGALTISLRIAKEDRTAGLDLDEAALTKALSAIHHVSALAEEASVPLSAVRATDILGLRGVADGGAGREDTKPLRTRLMQDIAPLVESFRQMRAGEGEKLAQTLTQQIDQIETLTQSAQNTAQAQSEAMGANLRAALERVVDAVEVDEARVAQELALIAVKADVTEEIDRLGAHVAAARELLAAAEPAGRKLDFLAQEFNREANTLCSKSQSTALTRIGLDLKAVIDQMREQVQNVE